MQPLVVFGSLDVWGTVASCTGGKSPSTFAAAFWNKASNNENSSALELASGFIMFRLTFIQSLYFKHFIHEFMIFAIIHLKTMTHSSIEKVYTAD
jgi:hypothetical protein